MNGKAKQYKGHTVLAEFCYEVSPVEPQSFFCGALGKCLLERPDIAPHRRRIETDLVLAPCLDGLRSQGTAEFVEELSEVGPGPIRVQVAPEDGQEVFSADITGSGPSPQ